MLCIVFFVQIAYNITTSRKGDDRMAGSTTNISIPMDSDLSQDRQPQWFIWKIISERLSSRRFFACGCLSSNPYSISSAASAFVSSSLPTQANLQRTFFNADHLKYYFIEVTRRSIMFFASWIIFKEIRQRKRHGILSDRARLSALWAGYEKNERVPAHP